jgi:hypothetical protein
MSTLRPCLAGLTVHGVRRRPSCCVIVPALTHVALPLCGAVGIFTQPLCGLLRSTRRPALTDRRGGVRRQRLVHEAGLRQTALRTRTLLLSAVMQMRGFRAVRKCRRQKAMDVASKSRSNGGGSRFRAGQQWHSLAEGRTSRVDIRFRVLGDASSYAPSTPHHLPRAGQVKSAYHVR